MSAIHQRTSNQISLIVSSEIIATLSNMATNLVCQGAESKIYSALYLDKPCIIKERLQKKYRVPELDNKINKQRLLQEARCLVKCRRAGIYAPW